MPEPLRLASQTDLHVEIKFDKEVSGVDSWGVDGINRREVNASPRKG